MGVITVPTEGTRYPAMRRSNVDLPQPDAPLIKVMPGPNAQLKRSMIHGCCRKYRNETSRQPIVPALVPSRDLRPPEGRAPSSPSAAADERGGYGGVGVIFAFDWS